MSSDTLVDIQRALNIIRAATDKEKYTVRVQALELITQTLLSQLKALEPTQLVKDLGTAKSKSKSSMPKPKPMPIPKSLNTPSSANNPNATIPNLPQSQAISANDINAMSNDFVSNTANTSY
jgi:hypothetical protein